MPDRSQFTSPASYLTTAGTVDVPLPALPSLLADVQAEVCTVTAARRPALAFLELLAAWGATVAETAEQVTQPGACDGQCWLAVRLHPETHRTLQHDLLTCVGWRAVPSGEALHAPAYADLATQLDPPPWPQADPTVPIGVARVPVRLTARLA